MNLRKLVGILLVIVGFTDNIWSWLTPNLGRFGALDGALIFVGAYLLFRRARSG